MGVPFNDQSVCVQGEDREGRGGGGRAEGRRESGGIPCRAQAVNSMLSGLLFVSMTNALCMCQVRWGLFAAQPEELELL